MTDNSLSPISERRTCQRVNLHRPMQLELSTGEVIEGQAEDISLGGVLLRSSTPLDSALLGQLATLYFLTTANQNSRAYPCRITRIIQNNMGLELEKDVMAAFGKELTKGMFIRKQAL
ncbi:MAG: PilZ domain-containing protein [Gammaproteobacteria bacterium]|nr:PilZ domain-containing protein [Gammaproteobacteria bacterium]